MWMPFHVALRCWPNIDLEFQYGGLNKVRWGRLSSNISLSFCVCGLRRKRMHKIKLKRKFDPSFQNPFHRHLSPSPTKSQPHPFLNQIPFPVIMSTGQVPCGRGLMRRWGHVIALISSRKLWPVERVCWAGPYLMFLFQVATKREFERRNAACFLFFHSSYAPFALPSLIH